MAAAARASAGYDTHQRVVVRSRVTERQSRKGHSHKHDAKHCARSGREQLPVGNEMTKPGASSFMVNLERTGPVCERNGKEEHRTKGGANGMKRRRTFRAVPMSRLFR
ncbi:MAG TPA: hypothetical protein PKZ57_00210 [Methanoregulaceae archaeon]|nr:hypothetical protein [Methanoregulaceae archaeon]HQM55914.1 hypothetical protein [Methanoregulaceae archaeon]